MNEQREFQELSGAVGGNGAVKLGALAKAFIAAKAEMKPLIASNTAKVQTKAGGEYKYTYSDLSQVYDVCEESLGKYGVAVFQNVYTDYSGPFPLVDAFTTLYHADSDQGRSGGRITLRAAQQAPTPQEMGSLITYARRYSLLAAVGLAPEDDDGKSASQRDNGQGKQQENGRQPATAKTNGQQPTRSNGQPPADVQQLADSVGATVTVKPNGQGPAAQLEVLGTELYGEQWPSTRDHNIATKFGQGKGIGDLTADEINKFINGLKKLKADRAAQPA